MSLGHHRSPFQVSYNDLIDSTEERIKWMERNYPRLVLENRIKGYQATHNIEVEKVKLKLFKKFKKDPQIDMFRQFEKL